MKMEFIEVDGGLSFRISDTRNGKGYSHQIVFQPDFFLDKSPLDTAFAVAQTVQRVMETIDWQQQRNEEKHDHDS